MIGISIHNLAIRLWPINRSITGDGVRETLSIIKEELLDLELHEIPSGTNVFDWTIPKEWKVNDAYIITPSGRRICDFKKNNLHLVGYSIPIRKKITLNELQKNLHSLPDQPNAIPYITSYYEARWGFCLSHNERAKLEDGIYEVVIDSNIFNGALTYADLIIPGDSQQEILISTYICHPSMANNELSGICVTTYLAKYVSKLKHRRYTYRFVFVPETIGSITYLAQNINHLKSTVEAGFNITCVGDNRTYSYLPSRNGHTISDKIAMHVLKHIYPNYIVYKWADRGSDERQYCSAGADLPIASIMRSKYGTYSEYHTSEDDLINVVTPEGLKGSYNALLLCITALENNQYPKVNTICEPNLGKRDLYPTLSTKFSKSHVQLLMDFITWADGQHSMLEIADLCERPIWDLYEIRDQLNANGLISITEQRQSS